MLSQKKKNKKKINETNLLKTNKNEWSVLNASKRFQESLHSTEF